MFRENQLVGNYSLIRKIGRGGFGEVWLAEKRSHFITKKVAIKLPLDEQVNLDAISQEANLWEAASGHPNILPIIDADIYNGQVAIVSEYADGGSLADKLKTGGKFSIKHAVEMTIGILNGLQFLHSKNIIHRDIKPANILLQGDMPRLADFGISRAMNTSTISSVIIGTEAYMSPESFSGKRNIQTDIWSVGVILYILLNNSLPFPQEHPSERMFAILMKEFEPLSDDIPQELKEILKGSLAKEPERRYQTASQMREQLQIFLSSISQSARQLPIESFQKPSFEHEEIETKLRTAIPLATEPLYKIQFKESEQNELKPRGRQFPLYYKFWERLLAVGKIKSSIHEKVKPRHNDGICVKNVRGLKFHYVVNQYNGRVEFYIDRGDAPLNKKTFDELIQHRREIDAAFGDSLSWERLDNRKTSRLGYYFNGGVKNNESDWQAIHSKMIDAMIRLEKAVSPFIPQLLGQSSFRQNNFVENRNPTSKEKIEIDERTVKQKTKK